MNNSALKYAKRLELDKILGFVSRLAITQDARDAIEGLVPSSDIYEVREALERCEAVRLMLAGHSSPSLSDAPMLKEITLRAEKSGLLSMSELLKVKTMLRNARLLRAWYLPNDLTGPPTEELFSLLYEDFSLEQDLERSILSDTEMSDLASGELGSIRKKIIREQESIRSKLDSIVHSGTSQKFLQDAVVTMRGGRFVVPVKNEHRGALKGLIHDVSSSGSTLFIEPEDVVEANNRIMRLRGEEAAEIERILYKFSASVSSAAGQLKASYDVFVQIDMLFSIARYADSIKATKPTVNDTGAIRLTRARHPLIDKNQVVPVDIALGEEYSTLVITGPNTGGKTVTLKTIGLLTLMAMCGIPVPADEDSELSVFDSVLVDIGDEQSIEQNLSTFSAHMKNIAGILASADARSLVLLDELGAGTDPAEGAALAVAILDRLRSLGCKTAATTHYGEVKLYALKTDSVQNASCEFDLETLSPTYRVTVGLPGRSNALLIGERLGLDKRLLDAARDNMSSDRKQMEDLLGEIEQLKSEASRKNERAENALRDAKEALKEAQWERDELIKQGQNELERVQRRAKELSADISSEAHKLLDELKKLEKDKKSSARAKEIAGKDSLRLYNMAPDSADDAAHYEPASDLRAGAVVYVPALQSAAEIVTPPDDKGMTEIKSGVIKSRIHKDELMKPTCAQKQSAAGRKANKSAANVGGKKSGRTEINLLGLTTEEAVMEAETFIDSAVLSHISTVYIIHGKGTGALRKAIHAALKTNKHVKAFRLGQYGEGESGVTVAELK